MSGKAKIQASPPDLTPDLLSNPRRVQRQRRLSQSEVDELVGARAAGAEIRELAARFDVNRSTVMAHLDRQGVPRRRSEGRTLGEAQVLEAGRLYASGESLVGVGIKFDVDKRYLSRVLREAGFEIRPPGRGAALR